MISEKVSTLIEVTNNKTKITHKITPLNHQKNLTEKLKHHKLMQNYIYIPHLSLAREKNCEL